MTVSGSRNFGIWVRIMPPASLSGSLVSAVNARDYPQVVGIVLVISVLFVALNLTVDVIYGLLDPRVRR